MPGMEISPIRALILMPWAGGASAGVTSLKSSAVMGRPASFPSLTSRSVSLRPIMPDAPVIRIRMSVSTLAAGAQPKNEEERRDKRHRDDAGRDSGIFADGKHDGRHVKGKQPEADDEDNRCDRGVAVAP